MHSKVHYTEILYYKALAELKAECGRNWAGALWWFADPLLSILVYYLAFGLILQRGGPGFISFLCVGIMFWRWFMCSVQRGATSIFSQASLMEKVYIPKMLFPAICLVADLFKFLITLVLLLPFLWFSGYPPQLTYVAFPLVLLVQILFTAVLCGFFAALVPFVPDLRNILNHGLSLLFFVTGIFFSVDQLSPTLRSVVLLNPMAGLIAAYRNILLDGVWPAWGYLANVFLVSIVGIVGVGCLLHRLDRVYAKYG